MLEILLCIVYNTSGGEEVYTEMVPVRVTPQQKEKLRKLARATGRSVGSYVRELIDRASDDTVTQQVTNDGRQSYRDVVHVSRESV